MIRHRQCVNEVGGTHDHAGERLWEHQGARFVKRHHDMLYATTRLRPAIAPALAEQRPVRRQAAPKRSTIGTKSNRSRADPKLITRRAIRPVFPGLLLIVVPPRCPAQLDRITVYSSRFTLRMIETVVISERRAGAAPGRAPRRVPPCRDAFSVTPWFPVSVVFVR